MPLAVGREDNSPVGAAVTATVAPLVPGGVTAGLPVVVVVALVTVVSEFSEGEADSVFSLDEAASMVYDL